MNASILLGIDGATFDIFNVMMADGHMPNISAFLAEGAHGNLLSTPHPLTPPAWTTLTTGRTPGNHGVFDFIWAEEREEQTYFTLNSFRDVHVETIWATVSRLGGTVNTLNFPFLSPPPAINGYLVPGLVSWKHLRRNVHPPALFDELQQLPSFNVKELAWDFEREKQATKIIPEDQRQSWIEHHVQRERHWYDIFLHLHEQHPAQLTAILIDGVDKLQHICWDALDPRYFPESPTAQWELERRLCVQYFEELDAFIGEVVRRAGEDARIFMASDHGFGPTHRVFRLNLWLAKHGYLRFPETEHLDEAERAKFEHMMQNHFVRVDRAHTLAYAQSAATNGIHIRVAREPGQSGVAPAGYEAFRDRMIQQLLDERDPATGEAIVRRVYKREEIFAGPYCEKAPDLTVILNDYGFISTLNQEPVHWDRDGKVAGTHHPDGIFCARGPGIPSNTRLERQNILDIAPTLLYSLGLPIPENYEGAPILAAFEPDFVAAHPVRTGGATPAPGREIEAEGLEETGEDELILDRLRALGYVE